VRGARYQHASRYRYLREGLFPFIPVGFLPLFVGSAARLGGNVLVPDPLASAFVSVFVFVSPTST
jgi:hypothetical protein